MQEYEDDYKEYTEQEVEQLVAKFKKMLRKGDVHRMSEEEMELIIDWATQNMNFTLAEKALKYAFQWFPYESTFPLMQARLYILQFRIDDATEVLDNVEARFYLTPEFYMVKALLCKIIGKDQQALALLSEAYKMDSEAPEIMLLLAAEYVRNGKYKKALDLIQAMLELDAESEGQLFTISCTFEECEKFTEAVKFFQRLTELFPLSACCWFGLGLAYNWVKEFPNAIESFLNAISLKGGTSSVHFNLASAYFELKNYEEAIENYKEALELDSKNYLALSKLGTCYETLGDYEKALTTYREVLDEDDDCEEALQGIIRVFHLTGRKKEADCFIRKAFTIEPRSFDLILSLLPYYEQEEWDDKFLELFGLTVKHFKQNITEIFYVFISYCCSDDKYIPFGFSVLNAYQNKPELALTIPYLFAALYYRQGNYGTANNYLANALLTNLDDYVRFLAIYPDLEEIEDVQKLIAAYEN